LQRRFSAAVGYGPKTFHSVIRFQRLLRIAGQRKRSLADLAASAGYSDQAHMTREVRRFSNELPTTLLQSAESTLLMSDLFKT
jgi:AraC-like DNA-binding protein